MATFTHNLKSKYFRREGYFLSDLLEARSIGVTIVPLPTPAIAFKRMLIGGQYAYASYIAAREYRSPT